MARQRNPWSEHDSQSARASTGAQEEAELEIEEAREERAQGILKQLPKMVKNKKDAAQSQKESFKRRTKNQNKGR